MGARQSVIQPSRRCEPTAAEPMGVRGEPRRPSGAAPRAAIEFNPMIFGQSPGGSRAGSSRRLSVPAQLVISGGGVRNGDSTENGVPGLEQLILSASVGRRYRVHHQSSQNGAAPGSSAMLSAPMSFPLNFFDIKCPVCHKLIPSEEILSEDKGECVICLEDMNREEVIARLPCLCVYHKACIDSWFSVKNSCPEHPTDDD